MCTVSYIPASDGFYLCSNRDEKKSRSAAFLPSSHHWNTSRIIYPKDPDGQGSWIAAKSDGTAAVLLNGAFTKHISKPPYRKSRGLILMEVIQSEKPEDYFEQMELQDIEPFTIIIISTGKLHEYRWDGKQKYCLSLDTRKAHFWCSATLYDEASAQKRKSWFDSWLGKTPQADQEGILNFHLNGGDGNSFDGLVINRKEEMKTVSITCLAVIGTSVRMKYSDLKTGRHYEIQETVH
jgi:hypothetical protein